MNFTEENTTENFKEYFKENKETVQQKAKRVLREFHKIGVDKEVHLKDFNGEYGQLNAEIYLKNTGYDCEHL